MILQDMFVGKVAWNNHSEFTSPTTNLWKSHLKSLDFSKYSLVLKVQERCFNLYLGVGLKYFYFHPSLGKIPTLTNIFQMGWLNHQPDKISLHKKKREKKNDFEHYSTVCPQQLTTSTRARANLLNPPVVVGRLAPSCVWAVRYLGAMARPRQGDGVGDGTEGF